MKHILEVKTISDEEPGEWAGGSSCLTSEWVVGTSEWAGVYICQLKVMYFTCQSPPHPHIHTHAPHIHTHTPHTHPAEEGTRKRSSSSQKHIGLEVTYKVGGGEHKLSLVPAPSHSRKQATEWLRALKKVRE